MCRRLHRIGLVYAVAAVVALGASQPAFAADKAQGTMGAPTVDADGSVRVEMLVSCTPAEVQALLADPIRAHSLSPDIASISRGSTSGACTELNISAKAVGGSTMDYRAQRCRTALGWRESLVESSSFTHMDTEWTVESTDAGTRVVLRVRTAVTGLPDFLVRSSVSRGVSTTATNLLIALGVR